MSTSRSSHLIEALIMAGGRSGTADARPHWHAAGAEPPRRARVQSRSQGHALGQAQVGAGSMTVAPLEPRDVAQLLLGRPIFGFEGQAVEIWFVAVLLIGRSRYRDRNAVVIN